MLQKKQQERNTPRTPNAPQTEEQVKFATQWNAGSSSEGTYSQPPPQPSTSKTMPASQLQVTAHMDDREFQNDCYEDNVESSFGSSQRYPDAMSASQIDNITQPSTFDCVNPRHPNQKGSITNFGAKDQSDPSSKSFDFTDRQSQYRNMFAIGKIPGLDDKPKETTENSFKSSGTAVVDLDQEEAAQEPEVEYTPPKDAPPIPAFKSVVPKRELIPIVNILDVPGRNTRPGW